MEIGDKMKKSDKYFYTYMILSYFLVLYFLGWCCFRGSISDNWRYEETQVCNSSHQWSEHTNSLNIFVPKSFVCTYSYFCSTIFPSLQSLRLYPQPPVLIRRSLEDDVLGKYPIKRSDPRKFISSSTHCTYFVYFMLFSYLGTFFLFVFSFNLMIYFSLWLFLLVLLMSVWSSSVSSSKRKVSSLVGRRYACRSSPH